MDQAVQGNASGAALSARLHGWGAGLTIMAAWLALVAATGLYRSDFISRQTILAVTFTMAIVGVLAIGQSLVAISGGFLDLSQPSSLILSSLVTVWAADAGMKLPVLVAVAVLTGMAWGFVNAAIIVVGKLNPIIVTLSTNFIGLAVLFLIFQTAQVPVGSEVRALGTVSVLGLPGIWWPMVVLVLIVGYLLPRTRVGRHAIAVGGNKLAAQRRGISLKQTRFTIFTLAGGFVGFAAVPFAAVSGPFNAGSGIPLQLNVIVAVILAGITLRGGRGNLWVLLLSVGFFSTIPTSLVFFGVSSDAQSIFQGLILTFAVAMDGLRARRSTV